MTNFGRTIVRPSHRRERTQWDRTKRRLARHRKFQAWFAEIRILKLGGGILVGVYGGFGLFSFVVGTLGVGAHLSAAPLLLLIGVACFVVTAFGLWVYRSAE